MASSSDDAEKTNPRKPGGVSRSIDFIAEAIAAKPKPDAVPKAAHLLDVAELLRITYVQAAAGDSDCGYFLGELFGVLGKKTSELRRQNSNFKRAFDTWKPVRIASAKDSALREHVFHIVIKARQRRRECQIVQHFPEARDYFAADKWMLKLPELMPTKRAVDVWFNRVVYPTLREMKDQLDADPRIANIARYHDDNTKLQLSRMKQDARDALMRIARLPQAYYFFSA